MRKRASMREQAENGEAKRASYRHLIPFKPGQSGNPGGRPRGIRAFRERFREHHDEYWERLHNLATTADKHQLEALKLLFAYGLGPPSAVPPSEESNWDELSVEDLKTRERYVLTCDARPSDTETR